MRTSVRLTPWLIGLLVLNLLPSLLAKQPETRVLRDGVGRELTVPLHLQRVYATSPVASMLLNAVAPDTLVGWNYPLGEQEKPYIRPAQRELPVLGGWFGENGKGNRETLLAAKPDLILSIGLTDPTSLDFADRLQAQTGIPVYVDSGLLVDTPETLRRLGVLLEAQARADKLQTYARRALEQARAFASTLKTSDERRLYYAEGLRGLQTDTRGSLHTEALDLIGAINVAEGPITTGYGRVSVSLDQILVWKPEILLICPEKGPQGAAWSPEWLSHPSWSAVPAVAKGRVYQIPAAPFNWLDRPPSAARLLGLKWLAWVLKPEQVPFEELVRETRQFYALFYDYNMSETEARDLLQGSVWKAKESKP